MGRANESNFIPGRNKGDMKELENSILQITKGKDPPVAPSATNKKLGGLKGRPGGVFERGSFIRREMRRS